MQFKTASEDQDLARKGISIKKLLQLLLFYLIFLLIQKGNLYSQEEIPTPSHQIIEKLYQVMHDTRHLFNNHKVEYSIEGGTLLGAVRHRGLIPWDTDLDIDFFYSFVKRDLLPRIIQPISVD